MDQENLLHLKINDENFCTIHKFGSTLIKWCCKGKDRIFLSSQAIMDGSKAIRGGIPVVFPNFGPWKLGPQHGFARISWWHVSKPPTPNETGDIEAELVLVDNEMTRAMWNYKFELRLKFKLSKENLAMDLQVTNMDDKAFPFTCLLHTYFRVDEVTNSEVTGLSADLLIDKISNQEHTNSNDELSLISLTDRIYHGMKHHRTHITNPNITIVSHGFPDMVVWNPWDEMKDLPQDEWRQMLCCEVGRVIDDVVLDAACKFSASQVLCVDE